MSQMKFFSPFMGGRNGDEAPDGALRLGTLTMLQIFPYGTLLKCFWDLRLIRVS